MIYSYLEPQLFLIYLIGVMLITGLIKEYNLFSGVYGYLCGYLKSKRAVVILYSLISGVLPVPGRCVISASMLDTIATDDKYHRPKLGIIDYLATHHYYFWSPLEKTAIIPMAVLSLKYTAFLYMIAPLLIAYLLFTTFYIFNNIKESDIVLKEITEVDKRCCWHVAPLLLGILLLCCNIQPYYVFGVLPIYYILATRCFDIKKLLGYINWKLVGFLSFILILSTLAGKYGHLVELLKGCNFVVASSLAWFLTFMLGSSAKFAGIVAILCGVFGIQYLPFFFALEFSAYLLSPNHKCLAISAGYFKTKVKSIMMVLVLLSALLISVGAYFSF